MSIARKIFCVAASFALPIIVLGYLVVRNINEHITFARYELAGTAYQRPLVALLRDIQDHQRLSSRCAGPGGCARTKAALEDSIRGELAALRAVDQRYGRLLQFTAEGLAKRGRQLATPHNVVRGWERLASLPGIGSPVPTAERDAAFDGLVAIIQTMITHVNDTSNLILDPELDTYHLVIAATMLLPKTEERLARVMREAVSDRTVLATQAAFLEEAERDQIKFHLDTALSENKNQFHEVLDSFQKDVPVAYAEYAESVDRFIAMTRRLARGPGGGPALDDYMPAGTKARNASFRLWETSVDELDKLIAARILYYERRRATALALSGLALLLACLLAYRIAASLIRPLDRLSGLLTPGADVLDRSVRKLAAFSQDGARDLTTMRILCDELDAHADAMRKTARGLASIVNGE